MTDICQVCGLAIVVGDYPCITTARPHARGANGVIGDDIPGGMWQENGFHEPRKFYSKSERKRALAEKGLEERVCNAGPHDKIAGKWSSVDLEAATILVSRAAGMSTTTAGPSDVPMTWTIQEMP